MMGEAPAVQAHGLSRRYSVGEGEPVTGLEDVSLTLERGEVVAVVGPSGSGKSTLLYLLGGLDRPQEGSVRVAGVDWSQLAGDERARFRRRACGFVVQGFALLPQATAGENVELPLLLDGVPPEERSTLVALALENVGLDGHGGKLPDQLSGGEQQRVAIARALVHDPRIFLADEPTGNLDPATSWEIIQLLLQINARGTTVLMATHNREIVDVMRRRVVAIEGGQIVRDEDAGGYHAPALESR
jgi:ABC-type lipoprotein export system ATPase subunit